LVLKGKRCEYVVKLYMRTERDGMSMILFICVYIRELDKLGDMSHAENVLKLMNGKLNIGHLMMHI
jgi:hypothetical protein